ncbi:MAG: crosslink repair DNA glycosylase YcaQ family protein [Acidobacteriota bacterium]
MPSSASTGESLDVRSARRLALARAGLLKRGWTGLPRRAAGSGQRARSAAHAVLERFGYLQLDTVAVAGARSHALVLLARLDGFDPLLAEGLLTPGAPLFEYWGHEASWIPIDLYPAFGFRRSAFQEHPWWGDLLTDHADLAQRVLRHVEDEGPLRSVDLEGDSPGSGWWNLKLSKRVATALWSAGELAIAERRSFQRFFDLTERVIDPAWRHDLPLETALETLLLRALDGHGWASTATLADTWRLRNLRPAITAALERLRDQETIVPCALRLDDGRRIGGWIRPGDLELAARLRRVRPRRDRGVLLSPFDPVLWDRARVQHLFAFEQLLEIFKPKAQRRWGYFCLPVLAGERLVARVDLKADRGAGLLHVRALHYESPVPATADREAVRVALERHALAVGLEPRPRPHEAAAA